MGSMESILQSSDDADLLASPQALQDHMDLLVKIRQLEVKVGLSKWSLEDLCQRAELPRTAGMHGMEVPLSQLIPCLVITPADCFWEGSKVLAPAMGIQIPW